jgi:hypothetical protein
MASEPRRSIRKGRDKTQESLSARQDRADNTPYAGSWDECLEVVEACAQGPLPHLMLEPCSSGLKQPLRATAKHLFPSPINAPLLAYGTHPGRSDLQEPSNSPHWLLPSRAILSFGCEMNTTYASHARYEYYGPRQ